MNKLSRLFFTVLLGCHLVLSVAIFADEDLVPNYVKSTDGVVTNSSGECWRTSYTDTAEKFQDCGYTAPEAREVEVTATPKAATITTKEVEKITLAANMLFDFDSSELTADAKAVIDERIHSLKDGTKLTSVIQIEGHTDNTGQQAYNLELSQRRAQAVADYIVANSYRIKAADIEVIGRGESDPIASNVTKAGRARNRRVVIYAECELIRAEE